MLNHLVLAEVKNAMLGNIILVSGSILLLLFLLKHFAWDAISSMMQKREEKIANDLDSAEKERQEKLANSHSEAAEIIKSAKDSGELSRQNILNETKEEVSRLKEKAHSDITLEKEAALKEVKDDVADLSLQIAEKILGRELTPENHESLINQYIEGLGSVNETR
mgnify:CR=1 FL=1